MIFFMKKYKLMWNRSSRAIANSIIISFTFDAIQIVVRVVVIIIFFKSSINWYFFHSFHSLFICFRMTFVNSQSFKRYYFIFKEFYFYQEAPQWISAIWNQNWTKKLYTEMMCDCILQWVHLPICLVEVACNHITVAKNN